MLRVMPAPPPSATGRAPADRFRGAPIREARPVIVGGSARSGTTLLRVILDAHPGICCGPESDLFLLKPVEVAGLADKFGFPEDDVRAMFARALSRPQFIDAFARYCCGRTGKRRWAEKSPSNVHRLEDIFRFFPQARFVHVLRDGRDVACSMRHHPRHRVENGRLVPTGIRRPIEECVRRWANAVEASRPFWKDPRYHLVRYEDLVTRPRPTLAALFEFLGEPWDEAVMNHALVASPFRDVTKFPQNPEAIEPIRESALGRWQKELSPADKIAFKAVGNALLLELGYASAPDW